MSSANFIVHGRLQFFLSPALRDRPIHLIFQGRQSVKHLVESIGIPHPEIGQVQVDGRDGTLDRITRDGNDIEVHPIENGCPVDPRFLLDGHLGRLASHLRMLGFDSLYQNTFEDGEMVEIAQRETRILLSRDRRLLMRKVVQYGYCPRSLNSLDQLTEVIQRFELIKRIQPFHRCPRCNHPLEAVEKQVILERLEPLTVKYFEEFHQCPACGQVYWKGSHYERMLRLIGRIISGDFTRVP